MSSKYNKLYSEQEVDAFVSTEITGNNFKSKIGLKFGFLTPVKLAGRSNQNKISYFCKCDCGNYVVKQSYNLTDRYKYSSCGCKYSEAFRMPLDQTESFVLENTNYEIIESSPLWDSKWVLRCKDHGLFLRRYSSVKTGKYGCPSCASFGFNPKRLTNFYVNSVWNSKGELISYKFGITNQNINSRIKQIKGKSDVTIHNELVFESDGYFALELEQYIKNVIPGNFLTRKEIPSGFTETISPVQLSNLIDILNNI